MKKFILILGLSALLLGACLPADVRIPQSPLLSTLERKVGLIAYIGIDGNIYVSDQGGGKLKTLTDDANIPETQTAPFHFYQMPTWSPDGKQLAFVGISGDETERTSDLYIAEVEGETPSKVYSGKNETPFYLYWTPDSATLSFLSSMASGASMILQAVPARGGERVVLDTGAPYYWSWAPDGQTMVVHAGGGSAASAERMAFLQIDSGVMKEDGLALPPASFQAPAWSPDGSRIALAIKDENDENSVIITDAAGVHQKTLGTFTGETAFAWSNDGEKVAYINSERQIDTGLLGALHVENLATSEKIVQERMVFAFFWSPNSEKIAYFVPYLDNNNATPEAGGQEGSSQTQTILMQLNVLDVQSGENREQFTFEPTQDFLRVLTYFDQYHQSNTIWSPDNNNLVLSFIDSQGQPGIAVVAASGQMQPRILAPGYLAFWSWK